VLLQQADDALTRACGEDPTFVCDVVLEWTGSERWAEAADVLLGKPLRIVIVLVIAWVLHRIARRVIRRFERSLAGEVPPGRRIRRRIRDTSIGARLPEAMLDTSRYDARAAARASTLGAILQSIATFVIWTVAVITILGELGINLGPLVASAGIAGVALGFGAQSLVKDFLAGMFILIEDQYGVGDIIDVGELSGTPVSGTVEAISLRSTKLRSVEGTVWHVPNGTVLRVGNMSQEWARALLDLTVAYDTDIDEAQRIIKATADALREEPDWRHRILEPPEVWGVEDLGREGVTLRLVVKTRPSQQWAVMRELRRRIKAAFDAAEMHIALPQRTVWLRGERPEAPTPSSAGAKKAATSAKAATRATSRRRAKAQDDDEDLQGKGAPEEA